jgi:hypothetical protein
MAKSETKTDDVVTTPEVTETQRVFPETRTFTETVVDNFGKRVVTKTETVTADGTTRVDH